MQACVGMGMRPVIQTWRTRVYELGNEPWDFEPTLCPAGPTEKKRYSHARQTAGGADRKSVV